MRTTKHVMGDLETYDTLPGAVILSIGAVYFDLEGLGHEFYTPVKFMRQETNVKLWGNGADFDNPILAVAHDRVKLKQCWNVYNGRCYRTVKNIAPGPKLERQGTHHNALDDAKSQALHMIELFKLHPTLALS